MDTSLLFHETTCHSEYSFSEYSYRDTYSRRAGAGAGAGSGSGSGFGGEPHLQRQSVALQVGQRASGGEALPYHLAPAVDRIVQLREDLHEVEAVADLLHAQVLQVRLEQQEDDVALQVVHLERLAVLAQAQRAEPGRHVVLRPDEDVLREAERLHVGHRAESAGHR